MRVRQQQKVKVSYTAFNKWYTRAFGVLLPGGNSDEFPHIRRHLKARRIDFDEIRLPGGGRYFVFPETERRKLPCWEGERFLPSSEDGETGHDIYHITAFQMVKMLEPRQMRGNREEMARMVKGEDA